MVDNPAPQPDNPPTATPDIPPPPPPTPEAPIAPTPPVKPSALNTPPPPNPRIKEARPYNWPIIILSLLLLVAIGFAGSFGYLYYQTSQQPPVAEEPITTPTPTPNPTANWETYTNTEYNYSIQFPPAWRTQQIAAGAGDIEATSSATHVEIFNPDIKTYNPSTGSNQGFITVQYFDLLPEQFSDITPNTQLGDVKAIKIDNTYYVTLEKGILEILVNLPTDTTKQSLFNQILSTFQFIDQPTNNSDCIITGCSGTICIDKDKNDENPLSTTCEWKESYSCFKQHSCERQSDGECGWDNAETLQLCLEANE